GRARDEQIEGFGQGNAFLRLQAHARLNKSLTACKWNTEMSECMAACLSDRAIVRVTGSGARAFLQGLITNDIDKAKPGNAIHAGLLTPQGKILFDFFVVPSADGFLLEVARAKAAELMQRLGFYKLRAQVDIAEDASLTVAAAWGTRPPLPLGAIAYADPRQPALGLRIPLPLSTAPPPPPSP